MSIGRIESDTALTATLGGRKPQIKGKLNIAELHLADIGINQRLSIPADTPEKANSDIGGQPEPEAENPVADTSIKVNSDTNAAGEAETPAAASDEDLAMLDREPIDFSALQRFSLDLDIQVDEIIGEDFTIDKLSGQVKLANGALRVAPVQMTFEGGTADLELAVDSRNTPSVSLKVTADDLLLAGVVPHAQPEMQVTGKVGLNIDVNSKGRSVYELASALTGKVDLGMEKVSMSSKYLGYLSADDTDTRVEVDGAVALNFGKQAELSAEAVRVTTDDGSYDILLGKLDMQPDLDSYLETGTLGFHDLTMTDLHAEIIDNDLGQEDDLQGPDWHQFDLRVKHWPFILVEKMQLSNLLLTYTRDDDQDTFKLDNLVLDNDNSQEPLQVSAVGTVNALALKLDGTVGTTAQPRGRNQVYPIDFALSDGNVDAPPDRPVIKVNGSIDRTLPDTSLMQATFDVAVTELVSIFNQERSTVGLGHLQGSLTVVDVDGRWGIRKLDIATTDTELYRLSIEGAVDDADKLDLTSEAEVPDPAVLGARFGVDLTGYGAYKGKGVISATRNKINYRGITNIGRIQNETTLAITLVEGKPFIQGKFVIPDLYLADIGLDYHFGVDPNASVTTNPHAGEEQKSAAPDPVATDARIIFDREPLDFGGLQFFNLDLEISINEITGADFSIEKLEGEIGLIDGVLRLSPMRMTFEGGSTNLEFELVTRNTPSVMLKVTADDLQLEEMMARMQNEVPVKGKTHLEIDITSSGHSEHELASNLSGKASFALEKARVPKKYVEFLTADLFGFLFRSVTFKDSYATLSCVVTGVEVDQGVAKTMLLFGEGPRLAVDGSATVDLGQETIDLVLLPKAKKRIGFDYSKITMTGSLADPDVKATGTGAASAATIGGAVLIPEIVVPVFLIEQVWKFFSSDDDAGCSDYIEKHQVEIDEFKAR